MDASAVQAQLIDHLCKVWQEPDEGIWEARGGARQFTHSKVMAWVALDRAIKHYERYDGSRRHQAMEEESRDDPREVCEKGFDPELNSFVQSYGSKELDASCLRIVLVGFLPPEDPRIRGTVEAIERRLMKDGFVQRYDPHTSKDGLSGGEGVFLACSFWLVTNLHLIGRTEDARELFRPAGGADERCRPAFGGVRHCCGADAGQFSPGAIAYCPDSLGVHPGGHVAARGRERTQGLPSASECVRRACAFNSPQRTLNFLTVSQTWLVSEDDAKNSYIDVPAAAAQGIHL